MKKHLIYVFIVSILFSGIVTSPASAQTVTTVQSVQAAIKAAGATWVAAENPITKLTPEAQKHLLGVLNAPKTNTHPSTKLTSAYGLPASIDWRNNGGNYVTRVRDQSACGSCWAHSAIAALESATLIANKTPNTELNLSEQVLISCCSSICSPSGDCNGGYPEKAADFLRDKGAPAETCYPYVMNGVCTNACPNWQASAYKIKSWEYVVDYDKSEGPSVDAIKAGLQYGPLAITYAVYGDFMSYSSGVYKHVSGPIAGFHAVLVVGYDDPGQYFIVKNSWGTGWGEQGYFRIAYSEVTGDSQFGYETIAYYAGDNPDPTCKHELADYFPGSGGTGTIQMSIAAGFNWAAASDDYWIQVLGFDDWHAGPGPATFTLAPNTTSSARAGAVLVFDGSYKYKTFPVVQEARSSQCTYTVSPTNVSLDYSGGKGNITVTTGSGCPWAAQWLVLGTWVQDLHSGSGQIQYDFVKNPNVTPRTVVIKMADQDVTFNQAGTPVYFNPTSQDVPANGGAGTVTLTTDAQFNWTVTSNADWITITSQAWGYGNGKFSYFVPANTGASSRTGTITVGSYAFTITQAGGSSCAFSVFPTTLSISNGVNNVDVSITTSTPDCFWQATSNTGWIVIGPGISARTGSGNGSAVFYVWGTSDPSSRTGTITAAGKTVTVTQDGQTCLNSLSSQSQVFTSSGGTGTISVTAPPDCFWWVTAANVSNWLAATGGDGTRGNGTVTYTVAANTGDKSRTGYINIGLATFTVTQAGGSTCSYSLSSTSQNVSASGGTGTVNVSAAPGCAWGATSNAEWNNVYWITITGGTSGSGSGTVSYSVTANTDTASRSGTMTIAGKTFTVTQAGGSTCTYTLSPGSRSFTSSGGTGTVSVTAGSGCTWTATSPVDWLTVTGGGSGSGNGTVTYSVAANTADTTQRQYYLTIGTATHVITQAATRTCTYTISPGSSSFTSSGGTGTVNVTTASGCPWNATTGDIPWIAITSGTSGSGNGAVTYAVEANTGSSSRNFTMNIQGQPFTVTQGSSTCTYAISLTNNSFSAAGGTGTVNITAGTGCAWSVGSSNTSWLTVPYNPSGSGSGTVDYYVAANTTTSSRNGTLTIAGQTFTVTQAGGGGCTYSISPASQNVSASGGSGTVTVTAGSGCTWTATSNNTSWLTVTSGASGSGNGSVSFSASANTGAARSGTITVGGQTFTVTQTGQSCTYTITPTSQTYTSAANSGSVNVTAPSGCSWISGSNTTWLSITYGGAGSGNGTVNYSVAANTTTSQRNGALTIAGQTFTVTQAGGGGCTYSISPTSNSFGAAAGAGSVSVTAGSGCAWAATSNNTGWLTVTSGSSGSGNGTVSYSVGANTSTATRTGSPSRTGTLTIGGQTHTVTQGGQTCTYSITPTSQSFGAATGTGTVNVTADSGCSWTAVSNATSWLSVTSASSGSGNGTVGYSVTANTSTASRTGSLTIAGQTFTVTQTGQSCTYAISPTSNSFTAVAGTGSVNVTSASGCTWTASSTASWITVTGGTNGSGSGSVSYSVTANTTTTSRTGTLSIAGQIFTVSQAGMSTCSTSLNTGGFNLGYIGRQLSLQVSASCAWSASTNVPWITFISGASGTGNGTVTFAVSDNTGAARTGTITIGTNSITINQTGSNTCAYTLSPTSQSFGAGSSTGSVNVTSASGCAWTASSTASWITVTGGASGSGSGSVSYSVGANTGASRTGTLTIAGQTFTVSQAGSTTCTYSITPASQSFTAASSTGSVNVTSASGCAWTASSAASWITVTGGTSGSGSGTVSYSVAANTSSSRTGTLTIAGQTFTVSQAGTTTCTYSITPASQSFTAASSTGSVNVTSASGCAWTASSTASWITVTGGTSGSGSGTVSYSVGANTGASRTGTLTIAGQTFTVSQAGTAPTCSVTLTTAGFNLGYLARQLTIAVQASSTCSWSASANVPWISFISGATGKGNGTITFLVSTNTGAARTGTITINGSTVTINQGGTTGK